MVHIPGLWKRWLCKDLLIFNRATEWIFLVDNCCQICEWIASDGYRIKYRYYPCERTRKGLVISLHGIQSHSGWYDYSSRLLSQAGYDVYFLDRRGSGLNSAQRGHAINAERLIQDVLQFLFDIRSENQVEENPIPVYLSGLSWGGKLATVVASRVQNLIDGLILLYPGICAKVRPKLIQKILLKLAQGNRYQFRKAEIPLGDPALFTNERNWQEWIQDDYMSLREATVSFYQSSLQLDALVKQVPEQIVKPVLVMLAGQDRIIDNSQTKLYFHRMGTHQKKLIEYPDAAHTLEFEPDRDSIFQELLDWMQYLNDASV